MPIGDGTRVVRAGRPTPDQGRPFLPGPALAAPFHLSGDPEQSDYVYGRYGNPSWQAYERALGELEGGEVVLFGSGMAAAAAVLLVLPAPGSRVTLPSDCYMQVRALAGEQLPPRGVDVVRLPTAEMRPEALAPTPELLWIETPSNPALDVCDIAALCAPGRERPALVVVDNTLATPLSQRPLELGADVSLASATKHLSGHADLLLGYVATRDPALAGRIRRWRTQAGAIAGPFEAWLAHRSLATLALRLERGCANALSLAEVLCARDDVTGVRYPGLRSDPAHAVAVRQMRRFGTVLGFDVGGRTRAERFLARAELVTEATSFGGVQTTAERRGRWGDAVADGFVRLSAGCEDCADLVADVEAALDGA